MDFARPNDLPGSIVFITRNASDVEEWYYEPLTTSKPVMDKDETKRFEAIVERTFLLGGNITLFVQIASNMSAEDKASVLVQDLYTLSGPQRTEVQSQIDAWVAANAGLKPVQAFYCRATRVSTVVSQVYGKVTGKASVAGPVFGVNGEYYGASSVYSARSVITWDVVPIVLPGGRGGSNPPPPPVEVRALKVRAPSIPLR